MLAQAALRAAPEVHRRSEHSSRPAAAAARCQQQPWRRGAGLCRRRRQPAGAPAPVPLSVAVAAASGSGPGQRQPPQEPGEEPPHGLRRLLQLALAALLTPFLLLANLLFVDPPDEPHDKLPTLPSFLLGLGASIGFLTVSRQAVWSAVTYLSTRQALPRVEALAGWLTGGSRASEVLAANTLLPLVRSPAMTIAAVLVLFVHYRALFWFYHWHSLAFGFGGLSSSSAALAERWPVMRALGWLFSPRGQALFLVAILYSGLGVRIALFIVREALKISLL